MHVCGNTELLAAGDGLFKMATNRPTWCLNATLPGIGGEALHGAIVAAFRSWELVCDLVFTEVQDTRAANILIIDHAFDGPSGILADARLPTPGTKQQPVRIDRSERWTLNGGNGIKLITVLAHEFGHVIGFSHLPSSPPPDLMEAQYDPNVNAPQDTEIAIAAKLYGLPKASPSPKPPVSGKPVLVTLEQDGRQWQGNIPRVK